MHADVSMEGSWTQQAQQLLQYAEQLLEQPQEVEGECLFTLSTGSP